MKPNRKNPLFNRSSLPGTALPAILTFGLAAFAHAATYDWTGTTNNNLSGTSTNWSPSLTSLLTSDILRWNSSTYTGTAPTANADLSFGQLLFDAGNTGGITFGAGTGTLTLNGVVSSGTNYGIQMNSGSGAVNTGGAKFALGASQTWINNGASLLTVGGAITNADNLSNKTLTIAGTGSITLSGVISNNTGGATTAIIKNGTGLVKFSGSVANSYDGLTTVTAGILALSKTAGVNAIAGNVTLGDGSGGDILRLDASNQIADTSVITLVGTAAGNRGWFQLNGQNETIGGLASSTANAGLVANESNSGDSTLTLNVTGNYNFSGFIRNGNATTGTLALIKTGNGTQTLGGATANTYTGLTDVQAGTLAYGANDAIGSGNVKVSGGTLDIVSFNDTVGTVTLTSGLITGTTGVLTSASGYVVESGTLSAKIAGSGALSKSTAGTVSISASNSYSGGTSINDGTLQIAASGALGTSGNISFGGGTLQYTAASQNSELANRFKNSSSAIRLDTNGASVPFGGVIDSTNTGGLIRSGTGTLQFYGSSANTYSGTTTSTGGNLYLNKTSGVVSVPGDVILGDGTGDDLMSLGKNEQIADTAVVTLVGTLAANQGRFRLDGNNETIGGLSSASTGAGMVENGNATLNSTLSLNVTGSQDYSGVIRNGSTGTLGLVKSGSGTQTLSGTNSYTGATTVSAGTLVVNGNISTSSLTTVQSGGTLGGSGTVGGLTINAGGNFSPGNSPGIMSTGDYIQNGQLNIEIEGLTEGNGAGYHDQVVVSGTVTLTGALNMASFTGFTPVNGDLIFILLNDSTDAVSGTFSGLAQGDVVYNFGGFDWQISYTANSTGNTFTGGNDIALMAIPEPNVAALIGGVGTILLLRRRRA